MTLEELAQYFDGSELHDYLEDSVVARQYMPLLIEVAQAAKLVVACGNQEGGPLIWDLCWDDLEAKLSAAGFYAIQKY